jgi:hypothetical protein
MYSKHNKIGSRSIRSVCSWACRLGWSVSLFLISITVIAAESLAYVSPGQPIPTGPPSSLVYMQVLAHEDDDFLFMNPDIVQYRST